MLVMHASSILVPPPAEADNRTQAQVDLWNLTKERVEKFSPGLLEEIMPPAPSKPPAPEPEPATTASGTAPDAVASQVDATT